MTGRKDKFDCLAQIGHFTVHCDIFVQLLDSRTHLSEQNSPIISNSLDDLSHLRPSANCSIVNHEAFMGYLFYNKIYLDIMGAGPP